MPLPDGGVLWGDCDPSRDGGGCATGEVCLFVEHYDRSICVRECDPQSRCGAEESACCAGSADAGAAGYCLPIEVCESLDAGVSDAGLDDAGSVDAGDDADAGTDAGLTEETDGGDSQDGGLEADAGTDAGTVTDAGTDDAGTVTDAG
ncbi:endonuclease, partial [Pyxidicoccus sp. 3LG]